MPPTSQPLIKPTDRAIQTYYDTLKTAKAQEAEHEGNVRLDDADPGLRAAIRLPLSARVAHTVDT